jgi:hypothetical protein
VKNKLVYVEENEKFQATRIFKNASQAHASMGNVSLMMYAVAVFHIRRQIWLRCKGECESCAAPVTESSGHMHEKQHRGKGGEISLENSIFICPTCHRRAHLDRNPHFTKKN